MSKYSALDTKHHLYKSEIFGAKCQAKAEITKSLYSTDTGRIRTTYHPPQISLPQWHDIFSSEAENTYTTAHTNNFSYRLLLSMAILTVACGAAGGSEAIGNPAPPEIEVPSASCGKRAFQKNPLRSCCLPDDDTPSQKVECYASGPTYNLKNNRHVPLVSVQHMIKNVADCNPKTDHTSILHDYINDCLQNFEHYASLSSNATEAEEVLDVRCHGHQKTKEIGFTCGKQIQSPSEDAACISREAYIHKRFVLWTFESALRPELKRHFDKNTRRILRKLFIKIPIDSVDTRLQGFDRNIHEKVLKIGSSKATDALVALKAKVPHIMEKQGKFQHSYNMLRCINEQEETVSLQHVFDVKPYNMSETIELIQGMIQKTIDKIQVIAQMMHNNNAE